MGVKARAGGTPWSTEGPVGVTNMNQVHRWQIITIFIDVISLKTHLNFEYFLFYDYL